MKRLILSVAIILFLAFLCSLHIFQLERLTDSLISGVSSVNFLLEQDRWADAQRAIDAVYAQWDRQAFYLHTTLRHADIDGIRTSLREIQAYLYQQEDAAECLAVAAKLVNQLELLLEAELPTIKNLL